MNDPGPGPIFPNAIGAMTNGGEPIPMKAIPAHPKGIDPSESEVMVGQWWQKVAVGLSAAAKVGVLAIPDRYLAAMADPQVIEAGVWVISLVVDGIVFVLANYIRKGRENGGRALSPLKGVTS